MGRSLDLAKIKQQLRVGGQDYSYCSLAVAAEELGRDISRLPHCLKILLENLLRQAVQGLAIERRHILAVMEGRSAPPTEIPYRPARVVMQDFTGVPAVVDLAVMRDGVKAWGGDPRSINPQVPVDLVIDHSLQVDHFGHAGALAKNVALEYQRNRERYEFLKWGARAFDNFRVVPPGTGIVHQVNLEYLAQTVWVAEQGGERVAYCDTCVGTDSHTTMVNALGVLGWGVGGIEAEAAMLGQAVTMMVPEVVGFKLLGELGQGVTATDLVLRVVEMLRAQGVVGKFVEFYGSGLDSLSLADRATIANMAPEYGATCGFFPIDRETVDYLRFTGRKEERVQLVEQYAQAQGLWREAEGPELAFASTLELNMAQVVPSLAGPKRPQDRIALSEAKVKFGQVLREEFGVATARCRRVEGANYELSDGDVVIAAITSCTNTSNPSVLVAAGLLAQNALQRGLKVKPWVKTSLAPGSQVVGEYLRRAGLLSALEGLGFYIVGYGCTTCIGNSGPLPRAVEEVVNREHLVVTSVLSGNRNFEGRISAQVKANFLASPPLVVAYALAGSLNVDLVREPLGEDAGGQKVYLKDLWPKSGQVQEVIARCLSPEMFRAKYSDVFSGSAQWQEVGVADGDTYQWRTASSYVQRPPYFEGMEREPSPLADIQGARPLVILGSSVTTDHISPAGAIASDSPAGAYLLGQGVSVAEFNSYGSRRGNHQVMMRGTFANIRLRNEMVPGTEGGVSKKWPEGKVGSIFDVAMDYARSQTPLVVVAGQEYGTGSSRDWAAKGTFLLGVKAVIAQSFERIHRSNLIGMGVLPLELQGVSKEQLQLTGAELFDITGIAQLAPRAEVKLLLTRSNGEVEQYQLRCRLDTHDELKYYQHGGILHYVLRNLAGN